jgi:hypothetical protein
LFTSILHAQYPESDLGSGEFKIGASIDIGGVKLTDNELFERRPHIRYMSELALNVQYVHYLGKWGLRGGIGYSEMNYSISNEPTLFEALLIIPIIVNPNSLPLSKVKYERRQLNVPIGVEYIVYQKPKRDRLKTYLFGEIQNSILLGQSTDVFYNDIPDDPEVRDEIEGVLRNDLSDYTCRLNFGCGINAKFKNPSLGYFIDFRIGIPLNQPSREFIQYPWSVGFSCGLTYYLQSGNNSPF